MRGFLEGLMNGEELLFSGSFEYSKIGYPLVLRVTIILKN